jgi:hypothetical protein
VPAVAVIRKRQVLFILNRFKGYLDGQNDLISSSIWLEFYVRSTVLLGGEMKFYDTLRTGKGEGSLLCRN